MSFDVDVGHCNHQGPRPGNEDFASVAPPRTVAAARGLVAAIAAAPALAAATACN